jgi:hypothetical protein
MGHWCGYVGVPKGHPLHGKSYDEAHRIVDLDVHGGLTYADACHGNVCHPTEDADPTWWLGFDCAHLYDESPGMASYGWTGEDHEYRTLPWVKRETERLAEQIAKRAS